MQRAIQGAGSRSASRGVTAIRSRRIRRINELNGRVNIKRISEPGCTAALRGPGSLGGTSLGLLGGKLGLPPECNVVLVATVCCLELVTGDTIRYAPYTPGETLTHGIRIRLAGDSGRRGRRATGGHVLRGAAGVRGLAIARIVIVTGRATTTPAAAAAAGRLLPL